jgi:5-methylcytosine-specific restriction endonuclease McrA
LEINDPSRVYTRKFASNAERSAKRRPFEFTAATKKLRFEQESGICQWCHTSIENRFKATYHHIDLIDEGGSKEPENCMVLHPKCHIDNFEVLHHGRKYRFGLSVRKNIKTSSKLQ